MMPWKTRALVGAMACALVVAVPAVAGGAPSDWPGPGSGAGWHQGRNGNWQGTGKNFGHGYRRDGAGNWAGTGKDFGQGWRKDSRGDWHGTGKHFGQGWRRVP